MWMPASATPFELLIVARFIVSWRHIANRFEQPLRIEPVDPGECGEFDGLEMPPRSLALNHFRLEEADDRFGKRVVIGVAAAADRRLDAGIGQAVRIAHRQILRATVTVMHEVGEPGLASRIDGLFERIEDE